MAIIGFIVVLLAALFFIMLTGVVLFANGVFGNNSEWLPVVVFGILGGGLLYLTLKWSPFVISVLQ